MRETSSITKFLTGLITNVDSKDVPPDAGTDGTQNLDPNVNGKLAGAPLYAVSGLTTTADNAANAIQFEWIERNDGKRDLVMVNNGDTEIITDFHIVSAKGSSTDTAANTSKCIVMNHEEAHIGCGAETTTSTSGTLTTSRVYKIITYETGDDFSNLGGTNESGNVFTASGTTPTDWTNGSKLRLESPARWSGYVRHGQFGGAAPGLSHENAECANVYNAGAYANVSSGEIAVNDLVQSAGSGFFKVPRVYVYHITAIYDGFQESPLISYGGNATVVSAEAESIAVQLYVKNYTSLRSRISGFNVYRAEYQSTNVTVHQKGAFTLVKEIDINDNDWDDGDSATNPLGGDAYSTWANVDSGDMCFEFLDEGIIGTIFSQDKFAENLFTTDVKYTVSCEVNGFHFVGNCLHDNLTSEDGSHMVFRSLGGWYDTFDWTKNYLRLPFVPKALVGYNGKVYAFDNNRIARITPEGFFIEDIYEGVGLDSAQGYVVTEFGLFGANKQGCYVLRNNQIETLSDRIKNNWQTDAASDTIALTYDAITNQIIFGIMSDPGKAYCYYIPTKRWDYLSILLPNDQPTGLFSDKDGKSYVAGEADTDEGIYSNFGSASERAWVWISPEYDFNDPSQNKMIDKVDVDDSVGSTTTLYSINGAASPPTTPIGSLDHDRGKTIQIKISGDGGATGEVTDSMSIVFRRMLGKR